MKNPRKEKTEVDLTTLIPAEQLVSEDPDDCFGREWDPRNKDCAVCHDIEICGIVKQKEIQGKKRAIEKKNGPLLDMTAFEKVPIDKIVERITTWAEDGDPATLEELEDTIGQKAQTKDKVAIREYINNILPRYNLKITTDKTIVPNEDIVSNINPESPLTGEDTV